MFRSPKSVVVPVIAPVASSAVALVSIAAVCVATCATLLVALALAPSPARADGCQDWLTGPLSTGDSPNGTDGVVYATTRWDPDAAGPDPELFVVAGHFSSIEGVPVSNIAARDPRTGRWFPLGAATDGSIKALAVYDGDLIAGGYFTVIGGQPADYIARWNGAYWQPLGGGQAGWVYALMPYQGDLLVAGSVAVGGQPTGLTRWDGSAWQWMGYFNYPATCMTEHAGELIVGGTFHYVDGLELGGVVRRVGSSWQMVGNGVDGNASALISFGGRLYAAADLYCGDPPLTCFRLARLIGSAWEEIPLEGLGDPGLVKIENFHLHGGQLYAAGYFDHIGGVAASNVARFDGGTWHPLAGGLDARTHALATLGDDLVAGGFFTHADGGSANGLARWTGSAWSSFGGGWSVSVNALIRFGARLVAAGDFEQSTRTAQRAYDIVAWDGLSLAAFGTGMNAPVRALESFKYPGPFGDYELIAGGDFTFAGGNAAQRIARWDEDPTGFPPAAWAPMGAGFNGTVHAIERFSSQTYAGGAFTASGQPVQRIARWNETTDIWEPLGTGMNGPVFALREYNGFLFAGGSFTTAGGVSTGGLARWNGASWSAVGGFFNGTVFALDVHEGQLIIGGLFQGLSGSPNLARYDGVSYSTLGTGGTNAAVRSLRSSGAWLYAGGEFTQAGGVTARHAAVWDGVSWAEVGGGTDASVLALAAFNGEVHAGGLFEDIREETIHSPHWARYLETGVLWIAQQPATQTRQAGEDAHFVSRAADGYGGLLYQWYKNGMPLSDGPTGTGSEILGATSRTELFVIHVGLADAGEYRLEIRNACGADTSNIATLTVEGAADVSGPDPVLDGGDATGRARSILSVGPAAPNPALAETRLLFELRAAASVELAVLDIAGRLVRRFAAEHLDAGRHAITWDGTSAEGRRVPAGVYVLRLAAGGESAPARRVVLRP